MGVASCLGIGLEKLALRPQNSALYDGTLEKTKHKNNKQIYPPTKKQTYTHTWLIT